MTKVNTDALTLKLHVANGEVWQALGTEIPRSTRQTVAEFIACGHHTRADTIRLLGTFGNAELIVNAYGKVQVELVSPLVCPTAADRKDPARSLYYMRKSMLAPSQGGFHIMEWHEQIVYGIAAMLKTTPPDYTKLVALASRHPVWPALTFINRLEASQAAALLGIVLDPRWYIDTAYPDRGAKLFTFLGLHPKTQAGVSVNSLPWRRHAYCGLVRSAWYSPEIADSVLATKWANDGLMPESVATCGSYGTLPGDFIWRVWAERMPASINAGADAFDKAKVKGELRGSQRFVHFLRLTWLSAIYSDSGRVSEAGLPLFRAKDFFKHVVEADGFNHHILRS